LVGEADDFSQLRKIDQPSGRLAGLERAERVLHRAHTL
jgi:hypothetical protein